LTAGFGAAIDGSFRTNISVFWGGAKCPFALQIKISDGIDTNIQFAIRKKNMPFSISLLSELPKTLAYLDPGSGSMILQMILAALLGGGVLLRTFWSKIFRKGQKPEEQEKEETAKDQHNQPK
jgi:hypothetical protein